MEFQLKIHKGKGKLFYYAFGALGDELAKNFVAGFGDSYLQLLSRITVLFFGGNKRVSTALKMFRKMYRWGYITKKGFIDS